MGLTGDDDGLVFPSRLDLVGVYRPFRSDDINGDTDMSNAGQLLGAARLEADTLRDKCEAMQDALQTCLNGMEAVTDMFERQGIPCPTYQRARDMARDALALPYPLTKEAA